MSFFWEIDTNTSWIIDEFTLNHTQFNLFSYRTEVLQFSAGIWESIQKLRWKKTIHRRQTCPRWLGSENIVVTNAKVELNQITQVRPLVIFMQSDIAGKFFSVTFIYHSMVHRLKFPSRIREVAIPPKIVKLRKRLLIKCSIIPSCFTNLGT